MDTIILPLTPTEEIAFNAMALDALIARSRSSRRIEFLSADGTGHVQFQYATAPAVTPGP